MNWRVEQLVKINYMIELKEWIEDGIDIRKTKDGYVVFTIPT